MIQIGAFLKQSFIDWEGKLTAVVFTKGCNFRCSYCHNPELVVPDLIHKTPSIEHQVVFDYLSTLTQWLDGVVVTGGEPTLQPNLIEFLKAIKQLGYAIKLDTNGSNPEVLETLLALQLVDFVALDIKTLPDSELYSQITQNFNPYLVEAVKQSINLIQHSGIGYEFRTTLIEEFHTVAVIHALRHLGLNKPIKFQNFRPGNVVGNYAAMAIQS